MSPTLELRQVAFVAALLIALAALATPGAAAIVVNCPPHPEHCSIPPLATPGGTSVSVTATVEAVASGGVGAIDVSATTRLKVVVTVRITSEGSEENVTLDVRVNSTVEATIDEPAARTATLRGGDPVRLEFPLRLDPDLRPGYVAFIPVTVSSGNATTSGYAPLRVIPPVTGPLDPTSLLVGLGGGLVVGGGAVAWWCGRRKKLPPTG